MFIYRPPSLKFPDTLQVEANLWQVQKPFSYVSKDCKKMITIPKGFKTDYGSVSVFKNTIGAMDIKSAPYILHDWLYGSHLVSRAKADAILMEALEEVGESWLRRQAIYYAVRIFGGKAWKKPAKTIQANLALLGKR